MVGYKCFPQPQRHTLIDGSYEFRDDEKYKINLLNWSMKMYDMDLPIGDKKFLVP